MKKKIKTIELVEFMKSTRKELVGEVWNQDREYIIEIIERLELHDVYKEGIENLLKRMREWIEEASR